MFKFNLIFGIRYVLVIIKNMQNPIITILYSVTNSLGIIKKHTTQKKQSKTEHDTS